MKSAPLAEIRAHPSAYLKGSEEASIGVAENDTKVTMKGLHIAFVTALLIYTMIQRSDSTFAEQASRREAVNPVVEARDYEKALNSCYEWLRSEKLNAEALKAVSDVVSACVEAGKTELVKNTCGKWAKSDPNSELPHLILGIAYRQSRDPESAIEQFVLAMEQNPNNPETHCRIAQVYLDADKFDTASEEFQDALRIDKDYRRASMGSASAEMERQIYRLLEGAKDAYKKGKHAVCRDNSRKALEILKQLGCDRRCKRRRMAALRLYGDSLAWKDGKPQDDTLPKLEESLKLAREIGDNMGEAEALVAIATHCPDNRAKSADAIEKALAIGEKIEDKARWSEVLRRAAHICTQTGDKEGLTKASSQGLELAKGLDDKAGIALYTAAADMAANMPEEFIRHRGSGNRGCSSGYLVLAANNSGLWWRDMSFSLSYTWQTEKDVGPIPPRWGEPVFLQVRPPWEMFLRLPVEEGAEWSQTDKWRAWGDGGHTVRIDMTVAADPRQIIVPAGDFKDCILLKATIAPEGNDEIPADDKNNPCGARSTWFAPGVGMVQLLYEHTNGATTEFVLTSYSLATESEDYFPIAVGNVWEYERLGEFIKSRETCRIAAQEDDRFYLGFASYSTVLIAGDAPKKRKDVGKGIRK